MNPLVLLAGAALILVALSKSKKDESGKVNPSTCLPMAMDAMLNSMTMPELLSLAATLRAQGYEDLAGCLEAMAGDQAKSCPQVASQLANALKSLSPILLASLASGLRASGQSAAADCLDAYATSITTPAIGTQPARPGPDSILI